MFLKAPGALNLQPTQIWEVTGSMCVRRKLDHVRGHSWWRPFRKLLNQSAPRLCFIEIKGNFWFTLVTHLCSTSFCKITHLFPHSMRKNKTVSGVYFPYSKRILLLLQQRLKQTERFWTLQCLLSGVFVVWSFLSHYRYETITHAGGCHSPKPSWQWKDPPPALKLLFDRNSQQSLRRA